MKPKSFAIDKSSMQMISYEDILARLQKNVWVSGGYRGSENEGVSLLMRQEAGKYKLVTSLEAGYDVYQPHELQPFPDRYFDTFEELREVLEREFGGLESFRFQSDLADDTFNHLFESFKNDEMERLDRSLLLSFLDDVFYFDMWSLHLEFFQQKRQWHELILLISFVRAYGGYQKEVTEQKIVERLCELFVDAVQNFESEKDSRSWYAWISYSIMDYLFLRPSAAAYLTDAFFHAMQQVFTWKPVDYSGNAFMSMYWGYSVMQYHENPFQAGLKEILRKHPDQSIRQIAAG